MLQRSPCGVATELLQVGTVAEIIDGVERSLWTTGHRCAAAGGGSDGVAGLLAIKSRGGIVIVQDPKEAKIPIMPKMAVTQDHVDLILPLADIAAVLPRLAKGEAIEKPS